MRNSATLRKIEEQIGELTPQQKLRLVEILMQQLRKHVSAKGKKSDSHELYGMGKGLWDGEDAQEYVNRLRKDRV
jgi:hypothetical protein